MSEIKIQFFIDHPEMRDEMSQRAYQYYKDHPEKGLQHGIFMEDFYSDIENRERASAIQMGQDYDKCEWTGFYVGDRAHVESESRCIKLNKRFNGCEMHHITPSVVIYIPKELHWHYIPHSLKTGLNMDIVNMAALQYLNGYYE